jgi:hypothetical protein
MRRVHEGTAEFIVISMWDSLDSIKVFAGHEYEILFRHRTFLSSRFETLAHYYLMVLFVVGFTLSGIARPLFYTPFILVAVTAIVVRIAAAVQSRKEQPLRAGA